MELIAAFLLGFILGGVVIGLALAPCANREGRQRTRSGGWVDHDEGIVYDRSGKAVMGFQPPPKNPHLIGPPQSRKVPSMGTGSASLPDDSPANPPPL